MDGRIISFSHKTHVSVCLHDPTTILAVVDLSMVTYVEGAVCVGITKGSNNFFLQMWLFLVYSQLPMTQ